VPTAGAVVHHRNAADQRRGVRTGISSGAFGGSSRGESGSTGSCIGGGTSGRGFPGGLSCGGSTGIPGVAGGISSGSPGICAKVFVTSRPFGFRRDQDDILLRQHPSS